MLQKDPEADRNFIEAFALSYEIAVNPVYPMPGLSEVLRSIRSKGIALGIISNAQFFTPLLFPAFLGTSTGGLGFSSSLCFYSYEFRQGKPGATMYEKSAEALHVMGIEPEHTLFVGNDMRNDILPAMSQGFQISPFCRRQTFTSLEGRYAGMPNDHAGLRALKSGGYRYADLGILVIL